MKKVTKYIAEDGREFDTEDACQFYEAIKAVMQGDHITLADGVPHQIVAFLTRHRNALAEIFAILGGTP